MFDASLGNSATFISTYHKSLNGIELSQLSQDLFDI